MKTSWPRVEASILRVFTARHALPLMKNPAPHDHEYAVMFGYRHEINPLTGATRSIADMSKDVDPLVARVSGAMLNDVLPVMPTAEMLACWFLANLPAYWDFVVVRAYDCFECRIERSMMTAEWIKRLAGK